MKSRSQQFLDAMEAKDASLLPPPITREDMFMQALVTRDVEGLVPVTDKERYLLAIESFLGTGDTAPPIIQYDLSSNLNEYTRGQFVSFIDSNKPDYLHFWEVQSIHLSGDIRNIVVAMNEVISGFQLISESILFEPDASVSYKAFRIIGKNGVPDIVSLTDNFNHGAQNLISFKRLTV